MEKDSLKRISNIVERIQLNIIFGKCKMWSQITFIEIFIFNKIRKNDIISKQQVTSNLLILLYRGRIPLTKVIKTLQIDPNVIILHLIAIQTHVTDGPIHLLNNNLIPKILLILLWLSVPLQQIRPSLRPLIQMGRNGKRRHRHPQWLIYFPIKSIDRNAIGIRKYYISLVSTSLVWESSHDEMVGWPLVKLELCGLYFLFLFGKD